MTQGSWALRSGGEADVPAMYELDMQCFESPFRFDLRSMRRYVLQPGAIVLVADAEAGLAGFVVVDIEGRTLNRLGYVVTLDVAPECRRSGLASELMTAAEMLALQAGARRMGLHVFAGNQRAIEFYKRAGYERLGLQPDFYGEALDAWSYRKDLG